MLLFSLLQKKNHIFLRSFYTNHHIFLRSFFAIYHIFQRSFTETITFS